MEVTQSTSIWASVGTLKGEIFLARHLLYRLYEEGVAILIYHPKNYVSTSEGPGDTYMHRTFFSMETGPIRSVTINVVSNPLASVADLVSSPKKTLHLSDESESALDIEAISVRVKSAGIRQVHIPFEGQRQRQTYKITGTTYVAHTPCILHEPPKLDYSILPPIPVKQVAVVNRATQSPYSLRSRLRWKLSALNCEEEHDWFITKEYSLENSYSKSDSAAQET
ncbi:MAG TPA: hypothetical protein VGH90_04250 [Chthoniobacteraceae bacterium]|jgi:hypothetical protein